MKEADEDVQVKAQGMHVAHYGTKQSRVYWYVAKVASKHAAAARNFFVGATSHVLTHGSEVILYIFCTEVVEHKLYENANYVNTCHIQKHLCLDSCSMKQFQT